MEQYIWQNKSWPHFFWNPQSLIYPLAELYRQQGLLEGQLKTLTPTVRKNIIISNLTSELVNSYKLDDIELNEDVIKEIITKKLGFEISSSKNSQISHEDVVKSETIVSVFLEIINSDNITAQKLITWNKELITATSDSEEDFDKIKHEEFRIKEYSYIKDDKIYYTAPSPKSLPAEMEQFINWFNKSDSFQELDNVLKSAITQFYMIALHPFEKNNNTLARMLAYKTLFKEKYLYNEHNSSSIRNFFYSVNEQIIKYKKDYSYMMITMAKKNMDITIWLSWYIRISIQAVASVIKKLDNLEKYELFMDKLKENSVNKRQEKALLYMLTDDDNKITTTEYSKFCKCSQDTAARDIDKLLSLNLVEKGDTGGRSTYYYVKL